jgi:hypothetical protein
MSQRRAWRKPSVSGKFLGTGSRVENETVIIYNEAEREAIVTTAHRADYRKLRSWGFVPTGPFDGIHHARFVIPKSMVCFRKPRVASPRQLAGLRKARAKAAANRAQRLRQGRP